MTRALSALAFSLLFVTRAFAELLQPAPAVDKPIVPGGELQILRPDGKLSGACPLKHTDVVSNVAGFLGRTKVKQTFHNPLNDKIEAIYVFPLPSDAAVDEMVMTVGDRRIVGQVKPREEARQVYEQAKAAGHVASLLDQERPNIFTQSVANVEPGAQVVIEISYVETLKYEDGWYEFSFPMVVGPRYMPGTSAGKQGEGFAPDTTQVPDASKISPVPVKPGTRAGHDISLTLNIDAGMEIQQFECRSHPVVENRPAAGKLSVALKNEQTIPNKDFILRYRTATDRVADALLTHRDARGGFFTLVLQPPQKVTRQQAVGRELIFVLDTSGSMQGFPITQAKFVMSRAIDQMGPQDTFNLITFTGDTNILWDEPRPNTEKNREEAQQFLETRKGSGGTEMMKAIDAALVKTKRPNPVGNAEPIRIVCFMTDGYVGNDMAIIDAVKKNAGTTRVFSFGIGSSVNRFLIDGMALAGRGESEVVTLEGKAQEAADRFYKRIDAPVLTDVAIDFGDLAVADVYPKLVPDLFSDRPVLVHGRLNGEVKPGTKITLRGNTVTGPFERKVEVKPAAADASHGALPSLWARSKVSDLMMRDFAALQSGSFPDELKKQVVALGTEFRLMTQFTSFVAVEELTVTKGGVAQKIAVPVEMPEGVSYEGVFGGEQRNDQLAFGGVAMYAGRGVTRMRSASLGVAPAAAVPAQQRGFQQQLAQQPAATGTVGVKTESLRELSDAEAVVEGAAVAAKPAEPADKLDPTLRDLADKVQKQGTNGSLTVGNLVVKDYKVDVMIRLADASEKTLAALKQLGFEQSAESKAVRLVIGSIDVRKLMDLVKLEGVASVKPVR
jgi:Ca-activated chloride channel family protein